MKVALAACEAIGSNRAACGFFWVRFYKISFNARLIFHRMNVPGTERHCRRFLKKGVSLYVQIMIR